MWEQITYTISYNANGGSGAPANQTKAYGTNLTLSSTKPTRSGYTFQGWATSAAGTVAYKPGDTYSANADLTLYAIWKVGDSKGPIKLYSSFGDEDGYGFSFIWENVETCSLEGIKIESSSYNSYTIDRYNGLYHVNFGSANTGDGTLKITLSDGSWCSIGSYYWGGAGPNWSSWTIYNVEYGN